MVSHFHTMTFHAVSPSLILPKLSSATHMLAQLHAATLQLSDSLPGSGLSQGLFVPERLMSDVSVSQRGVSVVKVSVRFCSASPTQNS